MTQHRHEQDVSSQAIQALLRSPQSTHGPAPEASAARMIRLLRGAYPDIDAQLLMDRESAPEQASLVEYLDDKIKDCPHHLGEADRVNPLIARTVQFIDVISSRDDISSEDKKKIWTQMKSIASTCPGMGNAWDSNHLRWSSNRIYNPLTKIDEMVIASPAEAMNLVCAAILDVTRYPLSVSGDEADLRSRFDSFCNRLLDLERQKEKQSYEICSAGRQHEMLFLLNMTYLDKPRVERDSSPIQLIVSTDTFLSHALSSYIESELSLLSTAERAHVILESMQWQAGLIDAKEYPFIAWLKANYKGAWAVRCAVDITERCMAIGINPEHCKQKITALIENIPYLAFPASSTMLEPLMNEIFKSEPFRTRENDGRAIDTLAHNWDMLVLAANKALETMKHGITPEIYEGHANEIRSFYKALEAMRSLNHYKDLRMFLGAEEGAFNVARETLQRELLAYYTNFSVTSKLPAEFYGPLQAYLTQQKAFAERSQVDFVENCFAALFAGGDFDDWWVHLQALKPTGVEKHPLELSDDVLEHWYRESVVVGVDSSPAIMDVSPYQINRILLHALLVPPSDWSPRYADSLRLVTDWLLQPNKPGQAILNTLKASYKGSLLSNLWLLSVLSPCVAVKSHLNDLCRDTSSLFNKRLLLSRIICPSTPEETAGILAAVEGRLGDFIPDVGELLKLLELDASQLNEGQRAQIWRTMDRRLDNLISDGDTLLRLLKLDASQLNNSQRNWIWMTSESKRIYWIKDGATLLKFLKLDASQLNEEQRNDILMLVAPGLGWVIRNGEQLIDLLELDKSQLNDKQRTFILSVIKEWLPCYNLEYDQMIALLKLPDSKLNTEQRTIVLTHLNLKLCSLIRNERQVMELLSDPALHLNVGQKTQILAAIESQFRFFIRKVDDLRMFLALDDSILNTEQRNYIIMSVRDTFDYLFTDVYQLRSLFSLSESKLTAGQRTDILMALQERLGRLIQNVTQLKALLELPDSKLNGDHRALIWRAVQGRLGELIQSDDEKLQLLALPDSQLDVEHRRLVTASIPHSVGNFIAFLKEGPRGKPEILRKETELGMTKDLVVNYIRNLGVRDKPAQVALIKEIFRNQDSGLHIYLGIRHGFSCGRTAEHQGPFKQLAEMIAPALGRLSFFSRTAEAYKDAVRRVPDPASNPDVTGGRPRF